MASRSWKLLAILSLTFILISCGEDADKSDGPNEIEEAPDWSEDALSIRDILVHGKPYTCIIYDASEAGGLDCFPSELFPERSQ